MNKDFTEAIILTEGIAERENHSPLCLEQVAGRCFLYFVINNIRRQGVENIIFCLGQYHQTILDWLQNEFPFLDYDYVVEDKINPDQSLIQTALQRTNTNNIFIVQSHILFYFNKNKLIEAHLKNHSGCTVVISPIAKKEASTNAGVCVINKNSSLNFFEEKNAQKIMFIEKPENFYEDEGKFIDISVPDNLNQAQNELTISSFNLSKINKDWTLFLDRDGVINEDKPGGYITNPEEFIFTKGSPELFKKLTHKFKHIIIVTNQRGVGRGIIKYENLIAMNEKMLSSIKEIGGEVDRIYFCTDTENKSFNRKPNPGMALQAKQDFPDIDFNRSLIVGNSISDMQFGRLAGMYTVFVSTTNKNITLPHPDIDLLFDGLESFAHQL